MARVYRKWCTVDDAELLTLIANADDHAFKEFVNRYAVSVVALASRVLGASPPADLPVAVFSRLRTLANEGPKEPASVTDWVLDIAFAISLEFQRGIHHDRTPLREEERRNLAEQIADTSDLFQHIEEYLARQTRETAPPQGRVGIAKHRYQMTPAFDDPLPEFEAYV
jgi:hypothetical protein